MNTLTNLPTLHQFITSGGTIDIGRLEQFDCAAVASDPDVLWVALARRPGEQLTDLLRRLDDTLAHCLERNVRVNEVVMAA
ncbi:MAG TPA: hypothetical protein VMT49_07945 [Steroidobacteraceae bacterium]|nr:hypothetical protein [Steroidobacteraceae bacterium]